MIAAEYWRPGDVIHAVHDVPDAWGQGALHAGRFATIETVIAGKSIQDADPPICLPHQTLLYVRPHPHFLHNVDVDSLALVWPCMIAKGATNLDGQKDWQTELRWRKAEEPVDESWLLTQFAAAFKSWIAAGCPFTE